MGSAWRRLFAFTFRPSPSHLSGSLLSVSRSSLTTSWQSRSHATVVYMATTLGGGV
jgi:hypothetical protein